MSEAWASQCEQLTVVTDRSSGAVAVVAVHDTRLGPAHGGIRRWPYQSLDEAIADAVALAQAMTCKCALAGVPAGGGKAVILDRPGLDREAAYRLVGRTVEQLGGRFFTGPDVGTTEADLRVVRQHTRFVATEDRDGPGDLAAATADGVMAAMVVLAERLGRRIEGLHVAVQGLGAVGFGLCRRLAAAGARLSVNDVLPERSAAAVAECGAIEVSPEQLLALPCDVFAPCALGGVLTESVAARLAALGVCGAANNPLASPEAARLLHRRGIVVVPDCIANAGALILGATWHLTGHRAAPDRVLRIAETTREVLVRAAQENVPPSELALRLASERVERAAGTS